MILLNFAHPLTRDHLAQVAALTGQTVARVLDVPLQLDLARPLEAQVSAAVERAGLTPEEWQTAAILVNPPGYAPAAAALLAELHGRIGYFPALLWVRPVTDSLPRKFEVAGVINLQAMRDAARTKRSVG
jgi:hypothetical protein